MQRSLEASETAYNTDNGAIFLDAVCANRLDKGRAEEKSEEAHEEQTQAPVGSPRAPPGSHGYGGLWYMWMDWAETSG